MEDYLAKTNQHIDCKSRGMNSHVMSVSSVFSDCTERCIVKLGICSIYEVSLCGTVLRCPPQEQEKEGGGEGDGTLLFSVKSHRHFKNCFSCSSPARHVALLGLVGPVSVNGSYSSSTFPAISLVSTLFW